MIIFQQNRIAFHFSFAFLFLVISTGTLAAANCSSIMEIYANTEQCDERKVVLTGKVSKLKYQASAKGNKYTTFLLNDNTDKPMKVFSFSHLQNIAEGNVVTVSGTFKKISATRDFEFPMQVNTTPTGVVRVTAEPPKQREAVPPVVAQKEPPKLKPAESVPSKEAPIESPKEVAPQKIDTVPHKPVPVETKGQEEKSTNPMLYIIFVAVAVIGVVIIFIVFKRGNKQPHYPVAKNEQPVSNVKPKVEPLSPIPVIKNEQDKSDTYHAVGATFEDYALSRFDMRDWVVVDRTKDFSKELGRKVESDSNPDLVLRHKDTDKIIAVECKYRSRFSVTKQGDEFIQWASEFNIKNYNAYREKTRNRIFIAIGVGGAPSAPGRLFLVPLHALQKTKASENYLNKFERNPEYKFMIEEFKKIDNGV